MESARPALLGEAPVGEREGTSVFEPPGGVLVWIVIFVEVLTFGAGLVALTLARRDEPEVFARGRALLSQPLALTNTLVLLTGGWLMARAVAALREGRPSKARRWLSGATSSGLAFLVLKGAEWASKLSHGLGLHHDTFFTYYWLLTGFHFLHVAAAVVILLALGRGLARGAYSQQDHFDVESGGAFWHMCDLVWLLLYPTLYLLGGAS